MIKLQEILKGIKPFVLGWIERYLDDKGYGRWVYPYSPDWVGTAGAPLTSTSFDGDSFSTTAKTLIDLSVTFGVPAGVKAVLVQAGCSDAASATSDALIMLSPNDTASSGLANRIRGLVNGVVYYQTWKVPCNANGDIYYQTVASGSSTMTIYLSIWGYEV